jgi:hypothetical protein
MRYFSDRAERADIHVCRRQQAKIAGYDGVKRFRAKTAQQ